MLKGKGTVWKASTRGGIAIYIPSDVTKDSTFPFKIKDNVNVEIDPKGERLIITKRV
jgi:hypothetical protein